MQYELRLVTFHLVCEKLFMLRLNKGRVDVKLSITFWGYLAKGSIDKMSSVII